MKFRSIQILRAFAVCVVVAVHAYGAKGLPHWAAHGAGVVDLFFVISGFVAALPQKPSFLYDRFWRIYPLWWIALAPWILIYRPDWLTLVTSITLSPVFGKMVFPALGVGWTLYFDILFYVAVAVAMRTGAKPILAIYALLLAGAVFWRAPIFNFIGNPMFIECLFGAALTKLPRIRRLGIPLLFAAVILFMMSPVWVAYPDLAMRAPASAWRVLYLGVPATLALYASLCLEESFKHRVWNAVVLLGTASYSIYLIHPAITVGLSLPWPVEVVLSIGAGLLMWRFLEDPLRRLKPRWRPKALVPAE